MDAQVQPQTQAPAQPEAKVHVHTRVRAQTAGRCLLVIFGAAGDLTKRLLVPALCNLRRARLLPEEFAVIGISRNPKDSQTFHSDLSAGQTDDDSWKWLAPRLFYLPGEFDDPKTYEKLKQLLAETDAKYQTGGNYLFYLATPPQVFAPIVQRLGEAGLVREEVGHWRRVVVEKPFGSDLCSAQALNQKILGVLAEDQIYRIDHYLGKETVQNIMVFRFANGIFEPLWNRDHIDHIQITVAETIDVARRGKFYDATGALRDMVPNHLFQLPTLTAMEPPTCFGAQTVRSEKAKVLEAIHSFYSEDVRKDIVRAQYGAGTVEGKAVGPYRNAANVAHDSVTETYVALKLEIDNWRWAGVPFYLRTGKAMGARRSEIAIQFKQAPFALFRDTPVERLTRNDLILQIQPEEGVKLHFSAKIPGPNLHMGGVEMKFNYRDYFQALPNTGYETLIYDCMKGDLTLFQRADNIEEGWRVVQPALDFWANHRETELPIYPAGSAGPTEADLLLTRDGRRWRAIRDEEETKSS
jgi:glucose-6-phosphate 1-dehydrogenase